VTALLVRVCVPTEEFSLQGGAFSGY
jgi:hypothetical protein